MEISFWLLDINHEVVEGSPEIRMWGLDDKGRRVLLIDRTFYPYFYVVPKNSKDVDMLAEKIRESGWVEDNVSVAVEEKRYFGETVKAVKVTYKNPENVATYTKFLSKNVYVKEVLHDDIRFSSQYLVDRNVQTCGWHRVDVEELPPIKGVRVDAFYQAKSRLEPVDRLDVPSLRVMAFSAVYHTKIGSPSPSRDPVLVVSTFTNEGEKQIFQAEGYDDRGLLKSFIAYVQKFNPDVVVGYGSNRLDLPYLLQRSREHKLVFAVDRTGGEPHTSLYGHMSVLGRANIDFLDFAEDVTEVKVKTLENFSNYLGIVEGDSTPQVKETEVHEYWKSKDKRPILVAMCERNAKLVKRISDAMLGFAFQLSNLIGVPVDHVCTAAVGFRVDWYLIRMASSLNELIPRRVEQPYHPYKGGAVLEPKPGLHENIAVLDFTAMYPNLMVTYNLSPDTYLKPTAKEPDGGVYVAPEVGYRFRKEPPGFYKRVLTGLMEARKRIQQEMGKADPESQLYKLLDARQRSIKVITNATYGYCGWAGARWYVSEVAEATAAWGRKTILTTIDTARKHGLDVVYSDTDSIFVKFEEGKIKKLLEDVKHKIALEIRPDVVYRRVLFTEAKKRYAGLLPDGKVDIVGLEVARGDWCEAAKTVQEKVLEVVLKEVDFRKAVEFVKGYISDVERGIFTFEHFIIWKTITKPVEEYQVRAPHVEAAKRLMKQGWKLTYGDKVGYIMVKGVGKLYEKATPYIMANPSQVDVDYYVENQIIPAALRILELFGVKKEDISPSKPAKEVAKATPELSYFLKPEKD